MVPPSRGVRIRSSAKKGNASTQADALSGLRISAETIPDDIYDIPTFFIDEENHNEKDFVNHFDDEIDINVSIDPEYVKGDDLLAAMDDSAPNIPKFDPVSIHELLKVQPKNKF